MAQVWKLIIRPRTVRSLVSAAFGLVVLGAAGAALSQDAATDPQETASDYFNRSKPYINPFHEGSKLRLVVFGDSLAEGVYAGLRRVLGRDQQIEIVPDIRRSSGLAGMRQSDWNKHLSNYLDANRVDIAVVMLGTYDNRRLGTAGNRFRTRTPRWRQAYAQKVDQFMRQLKRRKVAVYWFELPVSGYQKLNRHFRVVNEIVRERSRRLQIKYIDTWDRFVTPSGNFGFWGPDLTGRIRRLRAPDKLHFTYRGYARLASLVKPLILSDMARAEAARNVELTGKAVLRSDGTTADGKARKPEKVETAANPRDRILTPGVDLNDGAATPEMVEIVASATATLSAEDTARAQAVRKKQAAIKQQRSIMVKVFLRAEKLNPKPGRSDDFSWPRSE